MDLWFWGLRLSGACAFCGWATHGLRPFERSGQAVGCILSPLRGWIGGVLTEEVGAVGFTGSGYQRSLPVHESGAYNFSTPPPV
jgi:hypothetical protein